MIFSTKYFKWYVCLSVPILWLEALLTCLGVKEAKHLVLGIALNESAHRRPSLPETKQVLYKSSEPSDRANLEGMIRSNIFPVVFSRQNGLYAEESLCTEF